MIAAIALFLINQNERVDIINESINVVKSIRKVSSLLDAANATVTTIMVTLAVVNPEHNEHVIKALQKLQGSLRKIQKEVPNLRIKALKLKSAVQNIKTEDDMIQAYEIANQLKQDIVNIVNALSLDEETLNALGPSGTAISALQEAILKASNTIDNLMATIEEQMIK